MFKNLCLSSLVLAASSIASAAGFQELYNCNGGAAILDISYRNDGMVAGEFRQYQLVVRDDAAIIYLLRTGAVSSDTMVDDGARMVIPFGGQMRSLSSSGYSLASGRYHLYVVPSRAGQGIRIEGTGRNGTKNWYFDNCQLVGRDQ